MLSGHKYSCFRVIRYHIKFEMKLNENTNEKIKTYLS